jgi:hypothetical protein
LARRYGVAESSVAALLAVERRLRRALAAQRAAWEAERRERVAAEAVQGPPSPPTAPPGLEGAPYLGEV